MIAETTYSSSKMNNSFASLGLGRAARARRGRGRLPRALADAPGAGARALWCGARVDDGGGPRRDARWGGLRLCFF